MRRWIMTALQSRQLTGRVARRKRWCKQRTAAGLSAWPLSASQLQTNRRQHSHWPTQSSAKCISTGGNRSCWTAEGSGKFGLPLIVAHSSSWQVAMSVHDHPPHLVFPMLKKKRCNTRAHTHTRWPAHTHTDTHTHTDKYTYTHWQTHTHTSKQHRCRLQNLAWVFPPQMLRGHAQFWLVERAPIRYVSSVFFV